MKEDIEYTKMNASYQSNRISIFLSIFFLRRFILLNAAHPSKHKNNLDKFSIKHHLNLKYVIFMVLLFLHKATNQA